MFEKGDRIRSKICQTMTGTVVKNLELGRAIVIVSGTELLICTENWERIEG